MAIVKRDAFWAINGTIAKLSVPETNKDAERKPQIGEKGVSPRAPNNTPAAKPIVEYPINTGRESINARWKIFLSIFIRKINYITFEALIV